MLPEAPENKVGRADSPTRWLQYARADLAMAKAPLPPGRLYEHLYYHAQQAAEKSLKAVILSKGGEFPFTHNLQWLLDVLPESTIPPSEVLDAVALTPYGTTTRYPREVEPLTAQDRAQAVKLAESVVQWAETITNIKP